MPALPESDPVRIVIRVFKSGPDCGPLVLFPDIPGTCDPSDCQSFQRIGQHGAAHPMLCRDGSTRPATSSETEQAIRDLRATGYYSEQFQVLRRFPANSRRNRENAIRGLRQYTIA